MQDVLLNTHHNIILLTVLCAACCCKYLSCTILRHQLRVNIIMVILRNIPRILSPELLSVLARMGHGDEIGTNQHLYSSTDMLYGVLDVLNALNPSSLMVLHTCGMPLSCSFFERSP